MLDMYYIICKDNKQNREELNMEKLCVDITKEWLKKHSDEISKMSIPEFGDGSVIWVHINKERIYFQIERDDGSVSFDCIITFDYVIEHKDEITIYI